MDIKVFVHATDITGEIYITLEQIDLLKLDQFTFPQNHQLVVADLPCTGSGTWRRNPENLAFFNSDAIEVFSKLQQSILINLSKQLLKGQYLYFMTCSIFANENENKWNIDTVKEYIKTPKEINANISSQIDDIAIEYICLCNVIVISL